MSLSKIPLGEPKPLLEREGLLSRVHTVIERAIRGEGDALFIIGEGGLGKTSVLRQAMADVSGVRIGLAEGVASESRLPFGLLQQAWEDLGREDLVMNAGPEAASAADSTGDLRLTRFYRFSGWLARESGAAPLVIAIDDLHWADPDSLALLAYTCRRLRDLKVAVVATLRPWPRAAFDAVAELYSAGRAQVEHMRPLSFAAGSELLQQATGDVSIAAGEMRSIWEACSGNPLLLESAAMALAGGEQTGAGSVVGAGSEGGAEPQASSAKAFGSRLLLLRFSGLEDRVLRTAQSASIFGTRFRPHLVAGLAGLESSEAAASLQSLVDAGLLVDKGDGWSEFVHPLFRRALYDDMSEPARATLHALALRILREHGADSTEAALHARLGRLMGDPVALDVLRDATRRSLAVGGVGTALVHLRTAVDLAGAEAKANLRLDLAQVLVAAGQLAEAQAICQDLLVSDLDSWMRSRVLSCLAQASLWSADPARAESLFDESIEAASGDPARAIDAILEASRACTALSSARRLLAWAERARDLAADGAAGADRLEQAESLWAQCAVMCADRRGIELAGRAARVAGSIEARDARSITRKMWAGFSAFAIAKSTEQFTVADRVFTELFAEAEQLGSPVAVATLATSYADVLARVGRLDEAAQLVERAALAAEMVPVVRPWVEVARAHIGRERGIGGSGAGGGADAPDGDGGSSGVEIDAVAALAAGLPDHGPTLWLWLGKLRAESSLDAGRVSEAARFSRELERRALEAGVLEPCVVPWADTALDAYAGTGSHPDVLRLLRHLEEVGNGWECRWPRAVALAARAWLAETDGDSDAAGSAYREALELLGEVTLPLARARMLTSYAAFLRRGGHPRRARALATEAIEIAEGSGANRLARVARTELAACGGRRKRSSTTRWDLTPREVAVAGIAAKGASNLEIASVLGVTPKTVEHHLHSIYMKLGMSSRRELIRRWRLQGEGAEPGRRGAPAG